MIHIWINVLYRGIFTTVHRFLLAYRGAVPCYKANMKVDSSLLRYYASTGVEDTEPLPPFKVFVVVVLAVGGIYHLS